MSEVHIEYLADCPEHIPTLAGWFAAEWGRPENGMTPQSVAARLQERLNKDRVPLVLVGFVDGGPVGSASLKIREMETYPQYEFWLGSVYVAEERRKAGIGRQIVARAAQTADELELPEVYLYTRQSVRFYEHFGWRTIETPDYHGRTVSLMRREAGAV